MLAKGLGAKAKESAEALQAPPASSGEIRRLERVEIGEFNIGEFNSFEVPKTMARLLDKVDWTITIIHLLFITFYLLVFVFDVFHIY